MRKCGATSRQPSRIFCSSERGNRHLMFDVYSCSTGSGSCLGPRVGFGLRPVVKVTLLMTMLPLVLLSAGAPSTNAAASSNISSLGGGEQSFVNWLAYY